MKSAMYSKTLPVNKVRQWLEEILVLIMVVFIIMKKDKLSEHHDRKYR